MRWPLKSRLFLDKNDPPGEALIHPKQANVFVFGWFFAEGNGIHDTHLNEGSIVIFLNRAGNDSSDHDAICHDWAVIGGLGEDVGRLISTRSSSNLCRPTIWAIPRLTANR
jgi:hypothetical protein